MKKVSLILMVWMLGACSVPSDARDAGPVDAGHSGGSIHDAGHSGGGTEDAGNPDGGAGQCPATGAMATAPGCKAAGGVCVGAGTCGGTVATEHNAECTFSDGAGECCVAPAVADMGDSCGSLGGVCAPIAGCGDVNGWRTSTPDCQGAGFQCCVPQAVCGDVDVTCCGDSFSTVASCIRGSFECIVEGHVLMCSEACQL